jgi:hypothetical protein
MEKTQKFLPPQFNNWLIAFLTHREQRVKVKDYISDEVTLNGAYHKALSTGLKGSLP